MSFSVSLSKVDERFYYLCALAAKVFQTSSSPGHTKKFTGIAKIYDNPPMYVYDSPGVMVPWFGTGDEGADRAMKCTVTGS